MTGLGLWSFDILTKAGLVYALGEGWPLDLSLGSRKDLCVLALLSPCGGVGFKEVVFISRDLGRIEPWHVWFAISSLFLHTLLCLYSLLCHLTGSFFNSGELSPINRL